MMVEDITSDMRRLGQETKDIVLYIKFLSSQHCDFIPKQIRKGKTIDSQMFQKGCADLIEMFDRQSFNSDRTSLVSFADERDSLMSNDIKGNEDEE